MWEYFPLSSILSQDTLDTVFSFLGIYIHILCGKCHIPGLSSKGPRRNLGVWVCSLRFQDGPVVLFLLSRKSRFTTRPFFSLVFEVFVILYMSTYRAISIKKKKKNTRSSYRTVAHRPVTWWRSITVPTQVSGGCLKSGLWGTSSGVCGPDETEWWKANVRGLGVEQYWQQIPVKPFDFIPVCRAVYICPAMDKDLFPTPT